MEGTIATIMMFAGNFSPRNWAFCNGQLMSIAQNTALFSILGTTYGGDGRVTFGLPNLQGRVAIGAGQGPGTPFYDLGQTAGSESATMLSTQMPLHTHTAGAVSIELTTTAPTTTQANNNILASPIADHYATAGTAPAVNYGSFGATAGLAGGSQPFSVMQPFLGMNYVICLSGIFPARW